MNRQQRRVYASSGEPLSNRIRKYHHTTLCLLLPSAQTRNTFLRWITSPPPVGMVDAIKDQGKTRRAPVPLRSRRFCTLHYFHCVYMCCMCNTCASLYYSPLLHTRDEVIMQLDALKRSGGDDGHDAASSTSSAAKAESA